MNGDSKNKNKRMYSIFLFNNKIQECMPSWNRHSFYNINSNIIKKAIDWYCFIILSTKTKTYIPHFQIIWDHIHNSKFFTKFNDLAGFHCNHMCLHSLINIRMSWISILQFELSRNCIQELRNLHIKYSPKIDIF